MIDVIIEKGTKRVFASATDWPGWSRSGKTEDDALAALVAYGPRYARVFGKLGFAAPKDSSALRVVERVKGNPTTDFGAPGVAGRVDAATVAAKDLQRLTDVLEAGWRAFDATVAKAKGTKLASGPRGGGRSVEKIVAHVREAQLAYVGGLGAPKPKDADIRTERRAALDGLAASSRGEYPAKGPRGGVRWKPRYFVRRAMWHTLDHLWEIEDRLR